MTIRLSHAQAKAMGIVATKPKKRGPNKWERDFAALLGIRQSAGEITWWAYEAFKLRLADRTYYTPDFAAIHNNGDLEFFEVKGFARDDAMVKIKVAAEHFPFRFYLVKKINGQWNETLVSSREKT